MTTNIKPLNGYLLVKRKEPNTKTGLGIIIPQTARDTPQEGIVLKIFDEYEENGNRVKPKVKEGQEVLFSKNHYHDFRFNNEDILLIKEKDLLALVQA